MRWLAPILLAAACSRPPELPVVDTTRFASAVRAGIQEAYDRARREPSSAAASGHLGMLLHAHDQIEAARACYTRAARLDPKAFRWSYYLAVVESSAGRRETAIAALDRALSIDNAFAPALLRRADLLLELSRIQEAERIYADLVAGPAAASAHYGLGRIASARGDDSRAREHFARAVALESEYGPAHFALAGAWRRAGDAASAQQHQVLADRYKFSVPSGGDTLMAEVESLAVNAASLLRKGAELEARGRLADAVEAHRKALALDPRSEQAHVNLISLYGRLNQHQQAEEHYRTVNAINPNVADSHYNYGVLMLGRNNLREAREAFARSLAINPAHADAHNNLGRLVEQKGRLKEAAAHYAKAIESRPALRAARFNLARLLINERRYKEAIAQLEKTLEPEDEHTAGYYYALGIVHGRAGDREQARRYILEARQRAAVLNQQELLATIDKDLRMLGASQP